MVFTPATSKVEALLRIANGTGRPVRPLGPGSKEKKSALEDVAHSLALGVDTTASKPDLGSSIAQALGQSWDQTCWSAGHTITLVGLNQILRGAEGHPQWREGGSRPPDTASEASAIARAVVARISRRWDGKECVEVMLQAGFQHWAQMEWAGFYLEFVGVTSCIGDLGGGPASYANTRFDFALGGVWDFKAHALGGGVLILNDVDAIDHALADGRSVGFVVLSVEAESDLDGSFRAWHDSQKRSQGKEPVVPVVAPGYHRTRKRAVTPRFLDIFAFETPSALHEALAAGVISVFRQPRQPSGAPRKPKYQLSVRKGLGSQYHLHHQDL